jgi:hypothetical protein
VIHRFAAPPVEFIVPVILMGALLTDQKEGILF